MSRVSLSTFLTKITNLLADNTTGDISEADLRELFTDTKDSFAHLDVTDSKQDIAPQVMTGATFFFTKPATFGTEASPVTGNISVDETNAVPGVVCLMIHNQGTIPTFSAEFKKLSGSGSYVINKDNYIYAEYRKSGLIIYSINQLP